MSKLYDLFNSVISKLNISVKAEEQTFTDEEKAQIKENIGVAQPDLSVNDETNPAHVKGREFYTKDETILTELIPKTTFTFGNERNGILTTGEVSTVPVIDIVDGEKYIVSFDGVTYECEKTIVNMEYGNAGSISVQGIGNAGLIDLFYESEVNTNTGEPFLYLVIGDAVLCTNITETVDHSFGVSINTNEVVKLPMKYLPDGYPYKEYTIVSIPETTLDFTSGYSIVSPFIVNLNIGNEYTVVWNGVEYNCVAKQYDNTELIYIGNGYYVSGSTDMDTGEPFIYAESEGMGIVLTRNKSTHTISITSKEKNITYHTIDEKYLPDTIARTSDIEDVIKYSEQTLDNDQKLQARTNIGAISTSDIEDVVRYSKQALDDDQKLQARANIGVDNIYKDCLILKDKINSLYYRIEMHNGSIVSSCISISSIEVTTMPTKTTYISGEYFDPTGMVVTAICDDGGTRIITDYTYTSSCIREYTTFITITYTNEVGIILNTTIPITVEAFDAEATLIDFEYTANSDGTYTITGWKETLNGEASTEMIVPDNALIIL